MIHSLSNLCWDVCECFWHVHNQLVFMRDQYPKNSMEWFMLNQAWGCATHSLRKLHSEAESGWTELSELASQAEAG